MNRNLTRLAERRSQLIARAEVQRVILARDLMPWRRRLALAEQGIAAVRYVRSRPALVLGAVLLLAALRPRRVSTWLQRAWLVWQIGRKLRRG